MLNQAINGILGTEITLQMKANKIVEAEEDHGIRFIICAEGKDSAERR